MSSGYAQRAMVLVDGFWRFAGRAASAEAGARPVAPPAPAAAARDATARRVLEARALAARRVGA